MVNKTSTKKMTFALPSSIVKALQEAVKAGVFPSQTALVRTSAEKELKRIRSELLRQEFQKAAHDPQFLRNIKETEQAFLTADSETARMLPDD